MHASAYLRGHRNKPRDAELVKTSDIWFERAVGKSQAATRVDARRPDADTVKSVSSRPSDPAAARGERG